MIYSESTQVQQGCFFFFPLFFCNFDDQLSLHFQGFVILCIMLGSGWDIPSEDTGLWQLPNVSSAFKSLPTISFLLEI